MRVNIFFFFLVINCFSQTIYNNQINVSYKVIPNAIEIQNIEKDLKSKSNNETNINIINQMTAAYVDVERLVKFKLLYNQNQSVFYREDLMLTDDIKGTKKIFLDNFHSYFFYVDIANEESYRVTSFRGINYLVLQNKIEWEITTEEKIINDFVCLKANGFNKIQNKNFSVWFSPQIPFNIGPDMCYDLPGLVLEYNLITYSIVCDKVEFNLTEENLKKIIKPKGEVISQENFDELIRKARNSFKN
ncbi:GLPGLI family protein [Flavobacterium sp. UBA6135]|uniref:GLPGLI family protein n=1 Tax=Flavobacterium sp. UBA6135 TaxID=1946553 RepID=UPI0025BF8C19|nr:GLPGLI family protein [Flavobacterium sp. UBA6135]